MKTTIPVFLTLVCFSAVGLKTQAVTPAPDGAYAGANTAEGGSGTLFSLTTGTNNTALGSEALFSLTTGNQNTATGAQALKNNTADQNTADGFQALVKNTTGFLNTATGWRALFKNTVGVGNTANGDSALYFNTTGAANTANGEFALYFITTGSKNIALDALAGDNLTTGDNNIDIGNFGVAAEANTIRIGDTTMPFGQTATFIAGIYGTTTGSTTTLPVIVDSNGQLGTAPSSQRFKKDIKPMEGASQSISALNPVSFHYKSDTTNTPQFGLVAEQVAAVNDALIVRDKNGKPYTVRYDAVNAMLLNEFLKEHRKVEKLEASGAQQEKEIKALTASLKEQAAQIQKVSAQLEAGKPAPQMVKNL
jgi:hypothetical protein